MKDNRAEEIIRRKVRERESGNGLLEGQAALWAALDERLEKKPAPASKRYYTLWAAASVAFLLALGFYRYPWQKANPGQQMVKTSPMPVSVPAIPGAQAVQKEEKKADPVPTQAIAMRAHTDKKAASQQQSSKKPEVTEAEESPAADRAGLYAMPQIACAEMPATQYPLCSQTL